MWVVMINIAWLFVQYSFEKNACYMKLCSRTKCWQVTLRFNCHNNSNFCSRKNRLFSDLLYRVTMPLLFTKYQVPRSCLFSLQTFFSYTFTLANSLFSLFRPLFFNISHPPTPASRKIMVRPLTTAETGWRNGLKPSSLIHFNDIEQLLLLIILFLFLSFWRHKEFQRLSCIQFFY